MLPKIISDPLTGADNATWNLIKILQTIGFFTFIFLSILDVSKTKDFEYVQFASGLAIIFSGGGLGVFLQSGADPKQK